MLPPDGGYLQTDLVRLGRAISVAGFAGSRNSLAATPAQCSATKISQANGLYWRCRLVFAKLYHLAPGVLNALKIVKPETVIRWHRAGFRAGDQGRAEAGRRHRSRYAGSFAMSVWPTRSGARHGSMASCLSSALRSGRHGRQVHGQGEAPAIAGLENVH